MILIDTSIWIDFFGNLKSSSSNFLERILVDQEPSCINAIVEMEILQGIRDEKKYLKTKKFLSDFQYFPNLNIEHFDLATDIYRECRRKGVTIRKSLDCLIAANAMIDDLTIAHRDRDFEAIKSKFKELKTIAL